MVRIHRATGGTGGAEVPVNGKIAVIINGKLYNEKDFRRLFPVDDPSYGPSVGVSMGPTQDLMDRGFKVDGYNAIFEFSPGDASKASNAPVRTGAVTTERNRVGKRVLTTGGHFGTKNAPLANNAEEALLAKDAVGNNMAALTKMITKIFRRGG